MSRTSKLTTDALPDSHRVDVGVLAGLFDNIATSYKFFFLLALLDRIEGRGFSDEMRADLDRPIPIRELAVHMVMAAWFPHGFCRLSFGVQDQLQRVVDSVDWGPIRASWIAATGDEWKRLYGQCAKSAEPEKLGRFVPYRLIRPFFADETRGVPDGQVNALIAGLADEHFISRKPLYKFTGDRSSIILHHDWIEYLGRNCAIVRGWLRYQLAEYLQARNPSVPGIVEKLVPPLVRPPLVPQTAWWRAAIPLLGRKARCIYSGERLSADGFSLDHYLPWSYVAHNRAWNLIPVPVRINSMKSDSIPSDRYITALASLQHAALVAMRAAWPEVKWIKAVEPFMCDLQIDRAALLDETKLRSAYKAVLPIVSANARRQGFAVGWEYSAPIS